MICLWNNFHQLAAKNEFKQPKEPLWFLKAPNAYWPANRPIERPATYAGKIIYEGELGVVIGKKCFNISEAEAGEYIFGYTCVNDVTAVDLLRKDKSFEQWARAKSFDTFGMFGPVIATGIDPMKLSVKTILNGKERQNYPVADMFFPPHKPVAAIQKNGLKLEWHDGKVHTAKMKAVNKATEAGKQDIVVLAVKAHFLDQVVRDIDSMLGPDTIVLTVQNGLPWWYFQRLGGRYDNHRLESLDPSGILTKKIDPDRIIGCVVYPAAAAIAPGVVHHVEGDRFPIGELDGKETPRVRELHDVFIKAGLKSMVLPDIRSEIWLKAWGNLSFNPISALTHATLVDICQFAETRALAATMMKEAQDIAQKFGVTFRVTIDKRIAGAEAVGAHKTSMLQDVEAGRSLETEALIGSILEMAKLTNTAAPSIESVYALVKLLNKVMLLEGGGVKVDKVSKAA